MKIIEEKRITPKVNKHMNHAEDLVIMGGLNGIDWLLKIFGVLHERLKGINPTENVNISVKMDGAPSLFAWRSFKGLNDNGIAIKGLFAKEPKIMYSNRDVENFYEDKPQLVYKLVSFLKHFKDIQIPRGEIWQGDFLFDNKSRQSIEIDGIKYYGFHPNTIYYIIQENSELGKKIGNSDMGIVWHTRYKGDDIKNIEANYDIRAEELSNNSRIFMIDPYINHLEGKNYYAKGSEEEVLNQFIKIEEIRKELVKNLEEYKNVRENKDLISLLSIYWNTIIKNNEDFKNAEYFIDDFIEFIQYRFLKEELKRKTESGKNKLKAALKSLISSIEEKRKILELIINCMYVVTDLKESFIDKLNNIGRFETYLKMKNGEFRKTGQEGFAISDFGGNIVKLVSRRNFSFANFSDSVIKGW